MCLQRINQAVNQLVMVSFFLASSSLSFFLFLVFLPRRRRRRRRRMDGRGWQSLSAASPAFSLCSWCLCCSSSWAPSSYSSPAAYRTGAAIDLRFLADWFTSLTESRADLFSSFLLSFDSLHERKRSCCAAPMCFGGKKNLVVTIDGVGDSRRRTHPSLCCVRCSLTREMPVSPSPSSSYFLLLFLRLVRKTPSISLRGPLYTCPFFFFFFISC